MAAESRYDYEIEEDRGRVRLTVRGTLDDDTLSDAFREIYTHADYVPGLNELTDCRAVERFEMTAAGVRRLMNVVAELQTAERPYRVGIVTPGGAVFGMARMYELLQNEGLEEVRVFQSFEEADAFTDATT